MTDQKVPENIYETEPFEKIKAILIGNLCCAVAIVLFFKPNGFLSGGIGGIGIFLEYLTGFPASVTVFILNVPLFFVGIKHLNRYFVIFGFVSAVIFSIYLSLLSAIHFPPITGDPMLDALVGGALNGLGMGLMFRNGTCQGGLDIVAALMKKKTNMNIGNALMSINAFIIAAASVVFTLRQGLYTILALYIAYEVLDKIQMGFGESKQVIIVTNKHQEVTKAILQRIHRGVTLIHGEGAWNHNSQKLIYTVVSNRQMVAVKQLVKEIDPDAFVTITDAIEVKGRGFRDTDLH